MTHHTAHPTPRRAPRGSVPTLRATGRALVVLAVLASFATVAVDAGTAGAAGTRSVTIALSCSPTGITAGTTTTCAVTLDDTNSGSKNAPDGTVAFTVDSGTMKVVSPCTLAATSSSRSTCTTTKVLFQSARTFKLTATYSASDDHTNKTRTMDVVVAASSQVGVYSPQGLTSGTVGNTASAFGYGCAGSNRYVGEFVAQDVDPYVAAAYGGAVRPLETPAKADGSFDWQSTIAADTVPITFKVRLYCASAPVTSIYSSSILTLAPVITYTITAPTVLAGAMTAPAVLAGATTTSLSTASSGTTQIVTETRSPDALAATDTVDIAGAQMAVLKARLDATLPVSERVTRLAMAFRDRIPERSAVDTWTAKLSAGASDASYASALASSVEYQLNYAPLMNGAFVDRAYLKLLGRPATSTERTALVSALTTRTTTRPAMLLSIASSPEHLIRTATRGYVLAAYQALTPIMPGDALLSRFTRQLDDQVFRIQMIEDLALSRASAASWMSALTTAPATARF